MLGHASNLGRGDRGRFAAKHGCRLQRSVNLINDRGIYKSSFEKIEIKKMPK